MNKCLFVGRIASDPESRTTQGGIGWCGFRLAVQRSYKDQSGQRAADFINCVAWRQRADYIARYLKKGDMIAVCGELQNRQYEAQDGTKRYITEIILNEVQACGNSQPRTEEPAQETTQPDMAGFTEIDDDQLPF